MTCSSSTGAASEESSRMAAASRAEDDCSASSEYVPQAPLPSARWEAVVIKDARGGLLKSRRQQGVGDRNSRGDACKGHSELKGPSVQSAPRAPLCWTNILNDAHGSNSGLRYHACTPDDRRPPVRSTMCPKPYKSPC